jgi:hypothetical protein
MHSSFSELWRQFWAHDKTSDSVKVALALGGVVWLCLALDRPDWLIGPILGVIAAALRKGVEGQATIAKAVKQARASENYETLRAASIAYTEKNGKAPQILQANMGASRAYLYAVAQACDRGETTRKDAAGVILYTAEKATWMAGEAIQTLGGVGYTNEYATGRLWRDAKLYEIGAGTSEIRRMLIGRELMAETR